MASEDVLNDINILLIGETGVGKSTFVNSIANYLHFKTFEAVSEAKTPLILIPTLVTVTDKDNKSVTIPVGSKNDNEYHTVGAVGTQDVKTYVFPMNDGRTRLRFIDSPGMGDPRGVDKDDTNCENILAYLSQLSELHAICFFMKPTNPRVTVLFEYCVKQILSRLEKSASQNIIFIFTNTRGTNYTPGDTLPCLRQVVEEVKKTPPHVEIPLNDNNIFNLDNEAFCYLVATKHKVEYRNQNRIRNCCIESLNESMKECWRLINYIVGSKNKQPLRPHRMQNTLSINEAKRLVVQLSKPLADISQLIFDNILLLKRHRNSLEMENQTLKDLQKKLYIPTVDLKVTALPEPTTVCASPECTEKVKVGDLTKVHFRQRCHDPCYLTNVEKEIVGDPALMNCAAMVNNICYKCSCSYLLHLHIYYVTETVVSHIVDKNVQQNINQVETAVEEAQKLIKKIDQRKQELEQERDIINRSMAQFTHFLEDNAISPFNDAYKKYILYLISREEHLGRNTDQDLVDNLRQLLSQYEEMKKSVDSCHNAVGLSEVNPQTIFETVQRLYQLKHMGNKIRELMNSQATSRRSEYDMTCEYVHPKVTEEYSPENVDKNNVSYDVSNTEKSDIKIQDNTSENQSRLPLYYVFIPFLLILFSHILDKLF